MEETQVGGVTPESVLFPSAESSISLGPGFSSSLPDRHLRAGQTHWSHSTETRHDLWHVSSRLRETPEHMQEAWSLLAPTRMAC